MYSDRYSDENPDENTGPFIGSVGKCDSMNKFMKFFSLDMVTS